MIDGGQYTVEKGSGIVNDPGGLLDFTGPTSLVTNAINCRIDNQGLMLVNAGAGTLDLATPYPYDTYIGTPAMTNSGTIEVVSGVLKFPSVSFGAAGTMGKDKGTQSMRARR